MNNCTCYNIIAIFQTSENELKLQAKYYDFSAITIQFDLTFILVYIYIYKYAKIIAFYGESKGNVG